MWKKGILALMHIESVSRVFGHIIVYYIIQLFINFKKRSI